MWNLPLHLTPVTGGTLSRQEGQRAVAGRFELPVRHGEFDVLLVSIEVDEEVRVQAIILESCALSSGHRGFRSWHPMTRWGAHRPPPTQSERYTPIVPYTLLSCTCAVASSLHCRLRFLFRYRVESAGLVPSAQPAATAAAAAFVQPANTAATTSSTVALPATTLDVGGAIPPPPYHRSSIAPIAPPTGSPCIQSIWQSERFTSCV